MNDFLNKKLEKLEKRENKNNKALRINSAFTNDSDFGVRVMEKSNLESFLEKSNHLSSKSSIGGSKFDKSYKKLITEFNALNNTANASTSFSISNYTTNIDKNARLRELQGNIERRRDRSKDFSTKLKDLKYDFFTNTSTTNVKSQPISYLSTKSVEKRYTSIDKYSSSSQSSEKKERRDLLTIKMADFLKKSSETGLDFVTKKDSFNNANFGRTTGSNFNLKISKEEFRLFENKEKAADSRKIFFSKNLNNSTNATSSASKIYNHNFQDQPSFSSLPLNKREIVKKELITLLDSRSDDQNNFPKISRVKIIRNPDTGIFKSQNKYPFSHQLDPAQYPNEIIFKINKKFPDMLKKDPYIDISKNYIEREKIKKMKSQIEKFFNE